MPQIMHVETGLEDCFGLMFRFKVEVDVGWMGSGVSQVEHTQGMTFTMLFPSASSSLRAKGWRVDTGRDAPLSAVPLRLDRSCTQMPDVSASPIVQCFEEISPSGMRISVTNYNK